MKLIDLYSDEDNAPDFFNYDDIPKAIRVKIKYIIEGTIGIEESQYDMRTTVFYDNCYKTIVYHLGKEALSNSPYTEYSATLIFNYLIHYATKIEALKIIDLFFKYFHEWSTDNYFYNNYINHVNVELSPTEAILQLNYWLKKDGIGYQFEGGRIIRLDSTFIHSEIVKPTLKLLSNIKFQGANQEYLKAHQYYLDGDNEQCLNECLKAFESTLKAIFNEKKWIYNIDKDTSKVLIQKGFDNQLLPSSFHYG